MINWIKIVEAVTADSTRTRQVLAAHGRILQAWWFLSPATGVVIGIAHASSDPATAIVLLIAALATLWRVARPITALLVGAGITVAGAAEPDEILLSTAMNLMILVLAYAVGRHASRPRCTMAALTFAAGAQVLVTLAMGPANDLTGAVLEIASVVLVLATPAAVGMVQAEREHTLQALHERNELLARAALLGEERTRIHERARITNEVHDLLGHRLSLIALYAGAMELGTRKAAPEINEQADLIRVTARTALDELRTVLGILRLDGPEHPDGTDPVIGTRKDVTRLVAASRHAGQPLTLSWFGDDLSGADAGIRLAVNRIVRESLTNVLKHAPGAFTRLAVTVDAAILTIAIRNAVQQPVTSRMHSGLGLAGLRERARAAGGNLTVCTDPSTGDYIVTAKIPLPPSTDRPSSPPCASSSRAPGPHQDRWGLSQGRCFRLLIRKLWWPAIGHRT